ncbi:alkene reductase [Poriferisphaera sp. WC338]|uniref:alkene reductase n=1 Tax=Poriferisphaera sp. WC338 TaxID=3425129 RepID=UPI003D81AF67
MPDLFSPIEIGGCQLPSRIIMAPMTRGRAEDDYSPNEMMAEYYAQRASAGLIISEATCISQQGYGWAHAPGVFTDHHEAGWKRVAEKVHRAGGRFFLQLWHMGRVVIPDFIDGGQPVSSSAVKAEGVMRNLEGEKKPYVTPKPLTIDEIELVVEDYKNAAIRAISAGCDGVELHAANGYLVDQFLRDGVNQRTDEYGGSIPNRTRFLIEIVEALIDVVGSSKVGVRLSPTNAYNDMCDSNPEPLFKHVAESLASLGIAYVHVIEPKPDSGHFLAADHTMVTPIIRKAFSGVLIHNGGYTYESAQQAIQNGDADAIAFGLPFIANPDLPSRFKNNQQLSKPNTHLIYTHGAEGYIDYPEYVEA